MTANPLKRPRGVSPTECSAIPPCEGRGNLVPSSPSGVEEVATTPKTGTTVSPKAGRWTTREDDLLREAVGIEGQSKDWDRVSTETFHGQRSAAQCASRWDKVLSVGLKKGQWTEDEDAIVLEEVERGGGPLQVKWTDVAERLKGRLGKQVRERWQNHLDPALSKDPWGEDEDQLLVSLQACMVRFLFLIGDLVCSVELLVSLQACMGNKWSEIARAFAGRSENSVKNRWNSKQRKQLAAERKLRTGSELGIRGAAGGAHPEMGIKIDFSKAIQAAKSPHIVTSTDARRGRWPPSLTSPLPTATTTPIAASAPVGKVRSLEDIRAAAAVTTVAAIAIELAEAAEAAVAVLAVKAHQMDSPLPPLPPLPTPIRCYGPAVISDGEDDDEVKKAGALLNMMLSAE
eukprot:CAMPEP_0171715034 /NCGR_PEP_ID=MMETSP0991-20121206/18641_1 /TAXON_ID=483369 /ORGANISM="non described non described, Strain CCMP2098" /LENGTH=401 /DNA_ID=CAMNT_0012305871 /DNA_START=191 /DNA_END=1397 /DNA_ORIENTATION=-